MNRFLSLIVAWGMLAMCSCKGGHEEVAKTERPVRVELVKREIKESYFYTGGVEAEVYSDLAFPLSGILKSLPVELGQKVTQGSLIASLDPLDYQADYDVKRADYLTAKSQWERNVRLLKQHAVSLQEYELSKAAYVRAQSNYQISAYRLGKTCLRAPFDGVVTQKYVENYQRVELGEPIVRLMDVQKMEVVFLLPETRVGLLEKKWEIAVEFDQLPKYWFSAEIKEVVDASPDGSGIPVRLTITDSSFYRERQVILPGFSCRIRLNITGRNDSSFLIPLSAISKDLQKGNLWVWKYDTITSSVERCFVEIDGLSGQDKVRVISGMKSGSWIVVSGGNFITEGEKVKVITNKKGSDELD